MQYSGDSSSYSAVVTMPHARPKHRRCWAARSPSYGSHSEKVQTEADDPFATFVRSLWNGGSDVLGLTQATSVSTGEVHALKYS